MSATTLLDDFLPRYDLRTQHRVEVRATAEQVYSAMRTMDMAESKMVRWLLLLRSVPQMLASNEARQRARAVRIDLEMLQKAGFILLGERPPDELLLGVVGRFWIPSGGLLRMDAEGFRSFDWPGYAKVAWNFSISGCTDEIASLATETRVLCLDAWSQRWFQVYWLVVGPFSGLIRRRALRTIKRRAERGVTNS